MFDILTVPLNIRTRGRRTSYIMHTQSRGKHIKILQGPHKVANISNNAAPLNGGDEIAVVFCIFIKYYSLCKTIVNHKVYM